jgi:hypothetical protein
MGAGVILIKSNVADYFSNSNRHQVKNNTCGGFYFYLDSMFASHITFQFKINIQGK